MQIRVIGEHCMVQLAGTDKRTESGIQLVTEEDYQQQIGTVLAVGEPGPVNVGDQIMFEKYAGNPIDIGGEDPVMIVDYPDILAVIGGKDDAL